VYVLGVVYVQQLLESYTLQEIQWLEIVSAETCSSACISDYTECDTVN
jgi:hypothetical protein